MKDKRIWIVIDCILAIGTGVTHYTKYYVSSQGAAMMAGISAGLEETTASSSVSALRQLDTETGGADAGMVAGRAAPATPAECRITGNTGPGNAASGNTTSGDTGLGDAGPGNAAYAAAPTAKTAGVSSSDHAAPAMADVAEETMVSDTVGSADTVEGATISETASERGVPISPLIGVRTREYKASRIADYRKRLEDLDTQIPKMQGEETDSNVYPIKALAKTELKLWGGKLNSIYNALVEMLPREDGAKLVSEQQEWLKNRGVRAVESSSRNSGPTGRISCAATLVSLAKGRTYGLTGRYEGANGASYEDKDSSQTALPQQAKAWKEQFV